jgi:hypothetical protein
MSELTHVELVWANRRIKNRIRFGRTAEEPVVDCERRIVSFAPGASLRSSAVPPTTTAPSSRASTSCARHDLVSATQPCLTGDWVDIVCSGQAAGRSTPSR